MPFRIVKSTKLDSMYNWVTTQIRFLLLTCPCLVIRCQSYSCQEQSLDQPHAPLLETNNSVSGFSAGSSPLLTQPRQTPPRSAASWSRDTSPASPPSLSPPLWISAAPGLGAGQGAPPHTLLVWWGGVTLAEIFINQICLNGSMI